MKNALTILLLMLATTAWAQDSMRIDSATFASAKDTTLLDSVTFCSINYKVPEGQKKYKIAGECFARYVPNMIGSGGHGSIVVMCGNASLRWIYPSKDSLEAAAEQMASPQILGEKVLKKSRIKVYLLNKEVKGYKINREINNDKVYSIVAYGVINDQPVVVKLSFTNGKEPETNNDIPEFERQIIKFTK